MRLRTLPIFFACFVMGFVAAVGTRSLAIVLVGEALPVMTTGYVMLVAAVFLVGTGMSLLRVAGNPIMRDESEEVYVLFLAVRAAREPGV